MTLTRSFWISVLAILFVSPDSLFIRLSNFSPEAGSFFRSFGMVVGFTIVIIIYRKNFKFKFSPLLFLNAITIAVGQILFVKSIASTDVANVMVYLAGMPIAFAMVLSYFVLGKKTATPTVVTAGFCMIGVFFVAGNSLTNADLHGFLYTSILSFSFSLSLIIINKNPDVNLMPSYPMGGLMVMAYMIITTNGAVLTIVDGVSYSIAILNGMFLQTGFYICVNIGGKKTPPPIFALLLLLETVIATTLAIIFLDEIPTVYTVVGGVIVVSSLIVHNSWHLKQIKQ